MRERERLEDFRGGLVACRQCKRLLQFYHELHPQFSITQVCCGIAYKPTRHQVDLVIYDRLTPGDTAFLDEYDVVPPAGPVEIADTGGIDLAPVSEPPGPVEAQMLATLLDEQPLATFLDEAEIDAMAATAAQVSERAEARQAVIRRREGRA